MEGYFVVKDSKVVPWCKLAFKIFRRNAVQKDANMKGKTFKTLANENDTLSFTGNPTTTEKKDRS